MRIRTYLITGLLVWIPLVITLWVLGIVVDLLDGFVYLLPDQFQPRSYFGFDIPGVGLVLAFVTLLLTGLLATNVVGRRLVDGWHYLINRIPIVNSVYSGVRQISDTLLAPDGRAFRQAVLVPWPMSTSYTIAFVTGQPGKDLAQHLDGEFVNVYVPSTPNPTGGYYVLVRRENIIALDMSVETALKYVVSMGVATDTRSQKTT